MRRYLLDIKNWIANMIAIRKLLRMENLENGIESSECFLIFESKVFFIQIKHPDLIASRLAMLGERLFLGLFVFSK